MSTLSHSKQVVISVAVMFGALSIANAVLPYEKEIRSLSSAMAEKIMKANKKTVAVVDFTDLQGNVTELGRFLAEEFSVAMTGEGEGFEVVDRTHLKSLLQEHKLAMTGLIDPSTARKLGEIAGVQALITGTITPFGDSVRLSVKVLDTGTAKVIVATSGEIAKTKAIEELLAKGIVETEAASSPPAAVSPPLQTKVQHKMEVKGFIFEIVRCGMTAEGKVTCSFLVTKTEGEEQRATINCSDPYLYDDIGNAYKPSEVTFGGGQAYVGLAASTTLVPQVPENGKLLFEKVRRETKSVAVGIIMRSGAEEIKILFRNIPLTR